MRHKSESGRLVLKIVTGEDGSRFVALDLIDKERLSIMNDDLSLYLAVRPGLDALDLANLVNAATIAFDGIICTVTSNHPLFAKLKATPHPIQ